jgi:hypothetical protein
MPGEEYSFRTMAHARGNPYLRKDFKHRTSICDRQDACFLDVWEIERESGLFVKRRLFGAQRCSSVF